MNESTQETGPNVVLIGGQVTLDSGAALDTRQPIEGDSWDFVLRGALGQSEAFWARAKEFIDLHLNDLADSEPWVFAWVSKTIKRAKPDGTLSRVRTVKFLDDAVDLMDKSLLVGNANIQSSALSSRYRMLPHFLRFDDLSVDQPPAVFVGAFDSSYDDGTDLVGMRPLDHILSRWPSTLLVLPHTPLIEQKVQSLLAWHDQGAPRPARNEYGDVGLASMTHPQESEDYTLALQATEDLRKAKPYVVDADLKITHWIDRGRIADPAALDAAISFIKSRYDLDFGLWDLARDEVLRESLLDPAELEEVAPHAHKPVELVESAADSSAERTRAQQSEKTARRAVHDAIWPTLKLRGWTHVSGKQGVEYTHPAGPSAPSPYDPDSERALVFFSLQIHKKQAVLHLYAAVRNEATEVLLRDQAGALTAATGRAPEPDKNAVLRFPERGWDGRREDWNTELELVFNAVDILKPKLSPVVAAAKAINEEQMQRLEPIEITVEVDVDPRSFQSPESSRKKGGILRWLRGD